MVAKVKYRTDSGWYEAEVPDDVPLEQFLAGAEAQYGAKIYEAEVGRSVGEEILGGVKDVARGWLKNVKAMGGGGFGGSPLTAAAGMAGKAIDKNLLGGKVAAANAALDPEKLLPTPKLENRGRQYLRGGLEGAGGALLPGAGGVRGLVSAGAAGVGAEAGQDHGGTPGALAGGLLAGGVTGLGTATLTNKNRLAAEIMDGISPQELEFAMNQQKKALEMGTQLLPNQGMPNVTRLDDLTNFLAQTHLGTGTQDVLRKQPGWLQARGAVEVSRLPGQAVPPQVAADEVARRATDVIGNAKKDSGKLFRGVLDDRTTQAKDAAQADLSAVLKQQAMIDALNSAEVKKGLAAANTNQEKLEALRKAGMPQYLVDEYAKTLPRVDIKVLPGKESEIMLGKLKLSGAGLVPQDAISDLEKRLKILQRDNPNTDVEKMAGDALAALQTKEGYIRDPSQLKNAFDTALEGGGPNFLNIKPEKARLERANALVRDAWKSTVAADDTPLGEATAAFARHRETVVDPLKASVVGRMAGTRGMTADQESAIRTKLTQVFTKGATREGRSEIRELYKGLEQVEGGPQAFVNAGKTHIADLFDEATASTSIRTSPQIAAALRKAFYGTKQQEASTNELLAQMAIASGKSPKDVAEGFKRFLSVAGSMAERPARVTSFPAAEASRIAGESKTAAVLKGVSSPFLRAGQRVEMAVNRGTMRAMDQIFSSPDGLQQLQELAKLPLMSRRAQVIVGTLLGTKAAASGEQPAVE